MEKQSKNQKSKSVKAVPEGMHTVTPFLVVDGANELIRFIEQSFDGKTTAIMKTQDGKVMHASIQVGDSQIMVSDATEKYPAGTCRLYLYVDNVDDTYKKALNANGTSLREPVDEFYGDRSSGVKDNWGNEWWIATHVEDVDDEEMEKRARQFREGVTA
ncbi:VOC family protein [Chryseolinea sp. H1M3-3]|uniref:VOC family protein n=1 Tax=Chryseolinea sp. H1M3-3 TaxID=3034144 RepID=UPI0023ED8D4D|nr:VOC family protein [Chryseolinea sp. H1M3-3]